MATDTHESICIRVRRRFNRPETDTLGLQPLVDVALRRLCYDLAMDPATRNWVLTDPATTTLTLDADGSVSLAPLIASPRILLECVELGEITPPSGYPSTQPFRFVKNSSQGQLAGCYDSIVYKAWIEGSRLYTKSGDNNATPLAGDIALSVPYWQTLQQLDQSLVERLVFHTYWDGTPAKE